MLKFYLEILFFFGRHRPHKADLYLISDNKTRLQQISLILMECYSQKARLAAAIEVHIFGISNKLCGDDRFEKFDLRKV